MIYSSSRLIHGDMYQEPQWMLETMDDAEPYIYYVFSSCIHTDDNI